MAREGWARAVLAGCAAVFVLGSVGMSLRLEPMHSWYYCFAWWPFVLGLESWLFLRGGWSLLWESPRRFAGLAALSVVVWCLFEALNFRLGNWRYAGLPPAAALRWAGYALSYATVLPGLSATTAMFELLGLFEGRRCRAADLSPWRWPMALAGALMLGAAMAWPRWCFALVWAGWALGLEPVVHCLGGRSLLRDLGRGRPGGLYRLLAAGLACGLLWECWNYWSGARWYYTLPVWAGPRVFEMPLAGYVGFAPFAVTCHVMAEAAFLGWGRLGALGRMAAVMIATALVLAVFAGIDRFTVAALAG